MLQRVQAGLIVVLLGAVVYLAVGFYGWQRSQSAVTVANAGESGTDRKKTGQAGRGRRKAREQLRRGAVGRERKCRQPPNPARAVQTTTLP